jgi:DNA-binding transcriptional ArsR family regulator
MSTDPSLATVAALIGDPTRAAILVELMGGRALTATELSARAGVASSTASDHLARLVRGGLLSCMAQGRHRYYRLASAEVAGVIEAIGALAPPALHRQTAEPEIVAGLRLARTCYDHLAGRLGVAIVDALVVRQVMVADGDGYRLTPFGEDWLTAFGVDIVGARKRRRAFARACLDWTERRPHLAGALGGALLARLIEIGWIERWDGERVLQLTPLGEAGLRSELGVEAGTVDGGEALVAAGR